jgi:hypothetical protein
VKGEGLRIVGLRFWALGFGLVFWVLSFEYWISGLGFRV